MTLNTPVLYQVAPFDASNEHIFLFSYTGNQSVKNTLLIKDNETFETVYSKTTTTFKLSHTILADKLENGKTYQAQVKVYDKDDNSSSYSSPIIFKCLSTPTYKFSNISDKQVISATNYDIVLSYHQAEGEALNNYQFYLYDGSYHQIFTSGKLYNTDSMTCSLTGLSNNTTYYIRSIGETVSGMIVDTNMVQFHVEFIAPAMFSIVQATNNELAGTIAVSSNIVLIEGEYDGTPIYIDGTKIDLLNGNPVVFDEGFLIGANFTLQAIVENGIIGMPLISLDNGNVLLYLYQGKKYSEHADKKYIHLVSKSGPYTYVLDSNYFSSDRFQVNVRRNNNLYYIEVLEVI